LRSHAAHVHYAVARLRTLLPFIHISRVYALPRTYGITRALQCAFGFILVPFSHAVTRWFFGSNVYALFAVAAHAGCSMHKFVLRFTHLVNLVAVTRR